ncbi:PDxFFG protein [Candidatus Mycoplasma pogonae]
MKIKRKLTLWQKSLIAITTLAVGAATTIAAVFAYAANSDEVKGFEYPKPGISLSNDYNKIYNANGELVPFVAILTPNKDQEIAQMTDDGKQYWWNSDSKRKMDFEQFFNEYFSRYNEGFIQQVAYGSFSFYNEYVLAVAPEKFLEFTKWFIKEVAWGPDLISLDSFRIVPGVEVKGNSVTLGNHHSLYKEETEIKFFPDAFFGSLPIFSNLSGNNNINDKLSLQSFSRNVPKNGADDYLKNIPLATTLKNLTLSGKLKNFQTVSFKGILIPGKLINSKIKIYQDPKFLSSNALNNSDHRLSGMANHVMLPYDVTESEFQEYKKAFIDIYPDLKLSDFTNIVIQNAFTSNNPESNDLEFLKISFIAENEINTQNYKNQFLFQSSEIFTNLTNQNNRILANEVNKKLVHFLDFYDIESYLNTNFEVYENAENIKFFKSKLSALNDWPELDKSKFKSYKFIKFEKTPSGLKVYAKNNKTQEQQIFEFSTNLDTVEKRRLFREFKYAINYLGAVTPIALFATPEDNSLTNEKNKSLKGLDARQYQIFVEKYSGLIESVLDAFPSLKKKRFGPHIAKKINNQGFYEYEVVEGEYEGLSYDDRIGLPLILKALDPNWGGISTDFLKYVGAHEYGHHYTLEKTQALNNRDNSVIVGGIDVRSGTSSASFYSWKALQNYLKARTNLEVRKVNANGEPSEFGTFTQFGFIGKNGEFQGWESNDDIWGSVDKNDVFETVRNPRRRFLQTYESFLKAAELRNVNISDLFIANSLDTESGTLNPRIEGKPRLVYTDKNGKKEFKLLSFGEFYSQLKDGMGNHLVLESGTDEVKVIDYIKSKKGNYKITKIYIYNKNNTPVVQVPLDKWISPKEYREVEKKVNQVKWNIKKLFFNWNVESGWNKNSTQIFPKEGFNIVNALTNEDFSFKNIFLENSLLYRNEEIETNPKYNGFNALMNTSDLKRKAFHYFALNSNDNDDALRSIKNSTIRFNIKNNSQNPQSKDEHNHNDEELAPNLEPYPNYDARLNAFYYVDKAIVFKNGSKTTGNYFIPYSKDKMNIFSRLAYDAEKNHTNFFKKHLNTENQFQNTAAFTLARAFGIVDNLNNLTNGFISNKDFILTALDTMDQEVVFKSNQDFNHLKQKISGFTFNAFNNEVLEASRKFYLAFNTKFVRRTLKSNNKETKWWSPLFKNLEELMEWGSIDYSKAKKVIKKNGLVTWWWDINYVKSKFNFNKFKQGLIKYESNLWSREKINDNQFVANLLMFRFRKSPFFLVVKNFNPATELVQNEAILSPVFGIGYLNEKNISRYVQNPENKKTDADFTVEDYQKIMHSFASRYGKKAIENMDGVDFSFAMGNFGFLKNRDVKYTFSVLYDYVVAKIIGNSISSDVYSYNGSRNEPLIADKFTDYIYTISETLTRDFVQTTFLASSQDLNNLPSYLTNVTTQNSGMNFILDTTKLNLYKDFNLNDENLNQAYTKISKYSYRSQTDLSNKIALEYQKYSDALSILNKQIIQALTDLIDSEKKDLRETNKILLSRYETRKKEIVDKIDEAIKDYKKQYHWDFTAEEIYLNEVRISSNYFGNINSSSNGFMADRWQKNKIGMELYDPNTGEEIHKNSIRLKDWDGNKITSVPKAFFISQLLNYGVGSQTLSSLIRNKKNDTVAMYGFVNNEAANEIKQLKFTNTLTGEVVYAPININKTNNIFYYKNQLDPSSKVTLHDIGYSSWISDSLILGKYRQALMRENTTYYVDFADYEGNTLFDKEGNHLFALGNESNISENGKLIEQSAIVVENKEVKIKDKQIKRAVIKIQNQFPTKN